VHWVVDLCETDKLIIIVPGQTMNVCRKSELMVEQDTKVMDYDLEQVLLGSSVIFGFYGLRDVARQNLGVDLGVYFTLNLASYCAF